MPITKDEWDRGRMWETLEGQILLLLNNNKSKAFTSVEILDGLNRWSQISDFWGFLRNFLNLWLVEDALKILIREGKIRAKIVKKEVGEDTYYVAV